MTVQDTATVTLPQQAGPVDPPLSTPAPVSVPAPLIGRDRPLTADERACALGLTALALVLGTIIVVGLLVGQYVWS
jgi:hypothetical protein